MTKPDCSTLKHFSDLWAMSKVSTHFFAVTTVVSFVQLLFKSQIAHSNPLNIHSPIQHRGSLASLRLSIIRLSGHDALERNTNKCILQNNLRKLTQTSVTQHVAEAPSIIYSHLDLLPHWL